MWRELSDGSECWEQFDSGLGRVVKFEAGVCCFEWNSCFKIQVTRIGVKVLGLVVGRSKSSGQRSQGV